MSLRLRVLIATPESGVQAPTGNETTARRWAGLLRNLGHRVRVCSGGIPERPRFDVLVALHARKSAPAIEAFHEAWPTRPIVVALTGTDVYLDLPGDPAARRSLELATAVVALQRRALERLAPRDRRKAVVIEQSAAPREPAAPTRGTFDVCQLAHLRPVKDPLRGVMALAHLPRTSRLRLLHAGDAHDSRLAERARRAARGNPRYQWLGPLTHRRALRLLARSRLALVSSRLEGGCNVLAEALAAGVPIVATRIDATLSLLGAGYPGLYEVGDTRALRALLLRAETDRAFYERLRAACARRSGRTTPQREREAWRRLLAKIGI